MISVNILGHPTANDLPSTTFIHILSKWLSVRVKYIFFRRTNYADAALQVTGNAELGN